LERGLATINLSTKFKVSISTHYEDMKGNKMSKWGGMGKLGSFKVLKMTPFNRAYISSY